MRLFTRSFILTLATLPLLLGSFAADAAAQDEPRSTTAEPTDADVLGRLSRVDPRDVAWGARLAGQRGLQDAVPRLLDVIEGRATIAYDDADADADQERHVRNHVLDALIRLHARLPADSPAFETLGHRRAESLIFLSRDPQAHSAKLVRVFAESSGKDMDAAQVAAGNLLATAPASGFAAELLQHLPLSLRIRVRDAGSTDRRRGGRRNLSSGRGSGIARIPAGFPPLVYYDLTFTRPERAGVEWIEIARGSQSVCAVRREVEEGRICCWPELSRWAAPLCETWLSQVLTGGPDGLEFRRRRSESIDWVDGESYVRDVAPARDALLTTWYALVRRCFDAKLVSRDEALAAKPTLTVTVDDTRADQTVALPELPETAVTIDLPTDPIRDR